MLCASHSNDESNRLYFDKVMRGIDQPIDYPRFLKAILEFDDEIDLVGRLSSGNEGLLCDALSSDFSDKFFNSFVIPLIKKLGSDKLAKG